jgi:hypothetical protein
VCDDDDDDDDVESTKRDSLRPVWASAPQKEVMENFENLIWLRRVVKCCEGRGSRKVGKFLSTCKTMPLPCSCNNNNNNNNNLISLHLQFLKLITD